MAMESALVVRDKIGVQDFVLLENHRSEDAFMDNLRKRFKERLIYVRKSSLILVIYPHILSINKSLQFIVSFSQWCYINDLLLYVYITVQSILIHHYEYLIIYSHTYRRILVQLSYLSIHISNSTYMERMQWKNIEE